MMRIRFMIGLAAVFAIVLPAALASRVSGQVYHVAEMTADEIRGLNRETTVVILTGGILEQHGPYLPSFSDGYWNERLSRVIADAIAARPGWAVLLFPTIPLGNSGANDIGGRFSYPGTYAVRFNTLRAVFMDLAAEFGEQGFRRIFVVHGHGAPNHNRALDQAGDYFRDTYGGLTVNVAGLLPVFEAWEGEKTDAQREADGLPIHAGMDETSWMLFLRPQLVRAGYRSAPAISGAEMEQLVEAAGSPTWPGYFGAPSLASAAHGARIWATASARAVDLVLSMLDGQDAASIPRFSDLAMESTVEQRLDQASLRYEAEIQRKQDAWLQARGHR